MEFNSFAFIYFLVIVFSLYLFLAKRGQNWLLLLASYFFYGYWDARFLILIVASTLIDYVCALGMEKGSPTKRKVLLYTSIVANLGILGFFKYCNFFIDSMSLLLARFGLEAATFHLDLILPVGISFYTFQTMSYTIDVYRGKAAVCRRIDDFALFVCFFPQLVAGPIERASELIPQIQSDRTIDYNKLAEGFWLILFGFFQKVVVADNLALYVQGYRNSISSYTAGDLAVGFYVMVVFLYADFSGYSNIARGTARILGFEISQNFKMPLFAKNPADFWRRWHITLSDWFRDYCFKPMLVLSGKMGRKPFVVGMAAFLTLLLCGLWHGAAWNFVVFGGVHGLILVGYYSLRPWLRRTTKALNQRSPFVARSAYVLARLVNFHILCLPVLFFVVPRPQDWLQFGRGLLKGAWNRSAFEAGLTLLSFGGPFLLIDLLQEYRKDIFAVRNLRPTARSVVYVLLFAMIILAGATKTNEFVYFQF